MTDDSDRGDWFASALVEYTLPPADVARTLGVSDSTVRRWMLGARPRPTLAVAAARMFPTAVGKRLLAGWGYSPTPLDHDPPDVGDADTLAGILAEVRRIRRTLDNDRTDRINRKPATTPARLFTLSDAAWARVLGEQTEVTNEETE